MFSVILDDIARYTDTLDVVSTPLLEWIAMEKGNVRVSNETWIMIGVTAIGWSFALLHRRLDFSHRLPLLAP